MRGGLYKKTPRWLSSQALSPHIWYIEKNLGSYKVILIQNHNKSSARSESSPSKHKNPIMPLGDETELMKLVRLPETNQKKQQIKKILLETRGAALEQTCFDGTTALMVAASLGYIKTMKLLLAEERDFFQPKLLRQQRADGSNVLMMAMLGEQEESMEYLLKKAPSLVKVKCQNDRSIFSVVEKIQNQSQIVEILFKHLKEHRREKGYTDLLRECKVLKRELSIKEPTMSKVNPENGKNARKGKMPHKVKVIESREFKKHNTNHSWFFNDRMLDFVSQLKNFKREFQGVEKETVALSQEENTRKMRKIFKNLLMKNSKFRRLFLEYNNRKKQDSLGRSVLAKPSIKSHQTALLVRSASKRMTPSKRQKPNGTITVNISPFRVSPSQKNPRLSLISSSRFQEVTKAFEDQKEKRRPSSYKLVIQGQDVNKPLIFTTTELVVVKDKTKSKAKAVKSSKKKKV